MTSTSVIFQMWNGWIDEIVSSEAVIIVEFGLVVLRCYDAIGRGGGGVGAGLFV